jgi:hypothetical protein
MHRLAVAVEDEAVVAASRARGIISPVAVKAEILEAALRVRELGG